MRQYLAIIGDGQRKRCNKKLDVWHLVTLQLTNVSCATCTKGTLFNRYSKQGEGLKTRISWDTCAPIVKLRQANTLLQPAPQLHHSAAVEQVYTINSPRMTEAYLETCQHRCTLKDSCTKSSTVDKISKTPRRQDLEAKPLTQWLAVRYRSARIKHIRGHSHQCRCCQIVSFGILAAYAR